MIDTIDGKIDSLLTKIGEKKEALEKKKSSFGNWKTNTVMQADTHFNQTYLQTAGLSDIQQITIQLLTLQDYKTKANALLGIDDSAECDLGLLQGYKYEDWMHDLQKRAATLLYKAQVEKLDKMQKTLKQNLSSDKKRQMAIDEVEGLLG